jgi:DNA-binding response OmpR family regulator
MAAHGDEALGEFARSHPALVVLDLGLAGIDGLEVTRRLRRESDVPILMVTARSSESDKLLGLEVGADDYITKPFSTAELVARVRALLRRSSGQLSERRIELGDLRIDPSRRVVERGDTSVPLTTLEFDLLYFLAARPGRVFSREALMEHVWGTERVVDERSIDSLVSRLRRKLERDPAAPAYLQTVWGAGYRLMAPA